MPMKSVYVDIARVRRLTNEQKCMIAHVELEEYKNTIIKTRNELESKILMYMSILETLNLDLKDIERRKWLLNNVMRNGYNSYLGTYTAEALMRNHKRNMVKMSAEIENVNMKSSILAEERRKLRKLLKNKSGKSYSLQEVEIEEDKILCSKALESIAGLNQKIFKLKSLAIKAQKACNACKLKLSIEFEEKDRLLRETKQRIDFSALLKTTMNKVRKKLNDEMKVLEESISAAAVYRVPSVSDFIESVLENKVLDKKRKIQNQKLSLAKIRLNEHKRLWAKLKYEDAV
ncbi:unnamed protein product [Heterobilharzia americana]|nr:unnamed protein product [Heterobilharzia americana]